MSSWILLRGLLREARHWGDFPEIFRRMLQAGNLLTPDIPGNGRLNQLQSPASIEEMVEHVRAVLRSQQVMPPYSVLGLSMGGMMAVAWAEKYPEELQHIVLINTSLSGYSPFYHRLRPANLPGMLSTFLLGTTRHREMRVLKLTSQIARFSRQREQILQRWQQIASEHPVSAANGLRQLQAAMRYRASGHPPPVPVLLLCSQHDKLVNVRCSITLAESWQAEIRVHSAAGHDLPLDDGEWVAEQVREWLKQG